MSTNNNVEQTANGELVNGNSPRILQEHSIAIKFNVRDQLIKLGRLDALKKYDEEQAAAESTTPETLAPVMTPSPKTPETSEQVADQGMAVKDVQGSHKTSRIRELWRPNKDQQGQRSHGRFKQRNNKNKERRLSILHANQIWYGELYHQAYATSPTLSTSFSSYSDLPPEQSNDNTGCSDYGTGSIAYSEQPNAAFQMPQYQSTAPQFVTQSCQFPQAYSMPTSDTYSLPNPQAIPMPIPQAVPMPIPQAVPMPIPQAVPMPIPQAVPMQTSQAFPVHQVMQMPLQFDPHLAMYLFNLNPQFFEAALAYSRNTQQAPPPPPRMFAEAGIQTDQVSTQPMESAPVESIATQTVDEVTKDNTSRAEENALTTVSNETETVGHFELTPDAEKTNSDENMSTSNDVTACDAIESLVPNDTEKATDFADVVETAQKAQDKTESFVDHFAVLSTVSVAENTGSEKNVIPDDVAASIPIESLIPIKDAINLASVLENTQKTQDKRTPVADLADLPPISSAAEPTRELSKSTIARQRRRDNQKVRKVDQTVVKTIQESSTSPASQTPSGSKKEKTSRTKSTTSNDKRKMLGEKPAKNQKTSVPLPIEIPSTSADTLQKDRQKDVDQLHKISKSKKRTQAKNLRKAVRNTHEKTPAKTRSAAVKKTPKDIDVEDNVKDNGEAEERAGETNDLPLNVTDVDQAKINSSPQSFQVYPTCSAFRPFRRTEQSSADTSLVMDVGTESESDTAHLTDAANSSEEVTCQDSWKAASEPSLEENELLITDTVRGSGSERSPTILVDDAHLEQHAEEDSKNVAPKPRVFNTASHCAVNNLEKYVATKEVLSEPSPKKNKKHSGAPRLGNPQNSKLFKWAKNKREREMAEEKAEQQREDSKPGCSSGSKLTEKQMATEVKRTGSPDVAQDLPTVPAPSSSKISPEDYRATVKQNLRVNFPKAYAYLDDGEMEIVVDCSLYADALRAIKTPYDIFHVRGAHNRHLAYDTTGLLRKFVNHKKSKPLMSFTDDNKRKCEEYLVEQLRVYWDLRTPTGAKLEKVFRMILAFFVPDFYQDLLCLASLHSTDARRLEVHEKFLMLIESTAKFQSENQCIAYWHGEDMTVPHNLNIIGAPEHIHLSLYNTNQWTLRNAEELDEETDQIFKSLPARQKQMTRLGRTRDPSEKKWTSKKSKKFLRALRASAKKLEDPAMAKLFMNCYKYLLTVSFKTLESDLFSYKKIYKINPSTATLATHRFILSPWFFD